MREELNIPSYQAHADRIDKLKAELRQIKEECYNITDVSQDMKDYVREVFGDQDYSLSGYWIRAEQHIGKFYGL